VPRKVILPGHRPLAMWVYEVEGRSLAVALIFAVNVSGSL